MPEQEPIKDAAAAREALLAKLDAIPKNMTPEERKQYIDALRPQYPKPPWYSLRGVEVFNLIIILAICAIGAAGLYMAS